MRTHVTLLAQASDEQAIEAVAAIQEIAKTATESIQELQVRVQQHLAVTAQRLGERVA